MTPDVPKVPTDWYRFGDGILGVRSEDAAFRERFTTVFGECSIHPDTVASFSLPTVHCSVSLPGNSAMAVIDFDDPEPLDAAEFAIEVFADRSYVLQARTPEWSVVGSDVPGSAKSVIFRNGSAVAARDDHWRPLLGNLALNRVLRLQRGVVFLHAGAVAINGRGVLLCGPKMAGKTTASAALAARGHAFLGDELAALRLATRELLPFRRALSLRDGPRASAVDAVLAADASPLIEQYPDGTPRRRIHARSMFKHAAPESAPLGAVFVLDGFANETRVTRFNPTSADVGCLTPFASSMWGIPPAFRALKLAGLLSATPCYRVVLGPPDESAAHIERIVEDECP